MYPRLLLAAAVLAAGAAAAEAAPRRDARHASPRPVPSACAGSPALRDVARGFAGTELARVTGMRIAETVREARETGRDGDVRLCAASVVGINGVEMGASWSAVPADGGFRAERLCFGAAEVPSCPSDAADPLPAAD